jgi:TPP-dependent pyruvate/acetoin dehydrogenase alpha subunit
MQIVASGVVREHAASLTARDRIELLRAMMLARATEQRARTLDGREDDAAPAARRHREPIGAGAAAALRPQDRLVAPERFLAAHLSREEAGSTGRFSSAPDLVPIAVGVAFAVDARGSGTVVLTLADEGAMPSERWSEALALATARRLPVVLVVERDRPMPAAGSADQPLLGEAVDADDPEAVLTAVRAAVDRARAAKGPALVTCVARTPRPAKAGWRRGTEGQIRPTRDGDPHDPIDRYARRLLRSGVPRQEIEAALRSVGEGVMSWRP